MSYMHEVTCRINCLSFVENLKQLHQYSVSYSMYLDLEIDSILISTDSAKQCGKKPSRMSTTLPEISMSVGVNDRSKSGHT